MEAFESLLSVKSLPHTRIPSRIATERIQRRKTELNGWFAMRTVALIIQVVLRTPESVRIHSLISLERTPHVH